jgi:integrase/recombinase XerD
MFAVVYAKVIIKMETSKKTSTEIVKNYMRYLKLERNFSVNTLEAYRHDLDYLLSYVAQNNMSVLDVKLPDLQHFSASIHDVGVGARTQARILSGIRSFYRFLVLDGYLKDDPTELLENPQVGQHLPKYLTTEEVDQLENAIDLSKWEGQRNKAIIEVLFSCGLRVSELVNLKLSNLFEEEKFVRILGKGNKERLVPISQKALDELHAWYGDRNKMNIKPGEEDYVFLNRRGAHLTRTMILIMIKQYAIMAGITKTISPHTLRHSFATALLKGGADLRVIQAMLGHEDIGTTEVYTHLEDSDLRKAILEHHPRNIMYDKNQKTQLF